MNQRNEVTGNVLRVDVLSDDLTNVWLERDSLGKPLLKIVQVYAALDQGLLGKEVRIETSRRGALGGTFRQRVHFLDGGREKIRINLRYSAVRKAKRQLRRGYAERTSASMVG